MCIIVIMPFSYRLNNALEIDRKNRPAFDMGLKWEIVIFFQSFCTQIYFNCECSENPRFKSERQWVFFRSILPADNLLFFSQLIGTFDRLLSVIRHSQTCRIQRNNVHSVELWYEIHVTLDFAANSMNWDLDYQSLEINAGHRHAVRTRRKSTEIPFINFA